MMRREIERGSARSLTHTQTHARKALRLLLLLQRKRTANWCRNCVPLSLSLSLSRPALASESESRTRMGQTDRSAHTHVKW